MFTFPLTQLQTAILGQTGSAAKPARSLPLKAPKKGCHITLRNVYK